MFFHLKPYFHIWLLCIPALLKNVWKKGNISLYLQLCLLNLLLKNFEFKSRLLWAYFDFTCARQKFYSPDICHKWNISPDSHIHLYQDFIYRLILRSFSSSRLMSFWPSFIVTQNSDWYHFISCNFFWLTHFHFCYFYYFLILHYFYFSIKVIFVLNLIFIKIILKLNFYQMYFKIKFLLTIILKLNFYWNYF